MCLCGYNLDAKNRMALFHAQNIRSAFTVSQFDYAAIKNLKNKTT
ncbi:hypothetical protein SAMN06297358_3720 [Pedobacter xixiisoli]|uniref:Uncharacterized protein n=1 Tax=Pedobacter xixiisoli TaxID=1476464 RepID=A0A286ADM4_9SPHI|nr:hypothetical protein SAMN06297358_3720 [Pedobacter xixiisoli]